MGASGKKKIYAVFSYAFNILFSIDMSQFSTNFIKPINYWGNYNKIKN